VLTTNANGSVSGSELVDMYPGGPGTAFAAYGGSFQDPTFTRFDGGFLFEAYGKADERYPGTATYGAIDATNGVQTGRELWYSNGTAAGTHLVYDTFQGTHQYSPTTYVGNNGIPSPTPIFVLNSDTALFGAVIKAGGSTYLFATTGTSGGQQISPDGVYNPGDFTAVNGRALFTADIQVNSAATSYLFVTDGTAAGTTEITGPNGAPNGITLFSTELNPTGSDTEALFVDSSTNLWATDGTTATELTTGGGVLSNGNGSLIGLDASTAVFFESNAAGQLDLWVTNGTSASLIQQNVSAPNANVVAGYGVFTLGGVHEAFFETYDSGDSTQPIEIWATNGAAAGTVLVDGSTGATGVNAAAQGLVFETGDGSGNTGISVWGGPAAGTTALETSGVSFVHAAATGEVVFTETTGGATTLFETDGSAAGTRVVASGLSQFGSYLAANGERRDAD
jgi:ELWxxDGT repeat protein